jgi:uncharacterized membrane protein YdbT with pleckstrin-like domain
MAYPKNLLTEGEVVVHDLRPHWRGLVVPALLFLVIIFGGFYLLALIDNSQGRLIIGIGMLLLILWFSIRPFLQWLTTNYVFTDRRIIVRSGLIVRRGRDMPLSRINDVSFVHRPLERFLNSGTLYIESAGTKGELVIKDVPDVEQIQGEISRLRELDDERRRSQFAGPGHVNPSPNVPGESDGTGSTQDPAH